jgi:hypothetical protein
MINMVVIGIGNLLASRSVVCLQGSTARLAADPAGIGDLRVWWLNVLACKLFRTASLFQRSASTAAQKRIEAGENGKERTVPAEWKGSLLYRAPSGVKGRVRRHGARKDEGNLLSLMTKRRFTKMVPNYFRKIAFLFFGGLQAQSVINESPET